MYKQLADALWFGGIGRSFVLTAEMYGLEFRKGKNVEDVRMAMQKASRNGRGKTEFEVSMLEVYLKQVLKTKKGKA